MKNIFRLLLLFAVPALVLAPSAGASSSGGISPPQVSFTPERCGSLSALQNRIENRASRQMVREMVLRILTAQAYEQATKYEPESRERGFLQFRIARLEGLEDDARIRARVYDQTAGEISDDLLLKGCPRAGSLRLNTFLFYRSEMAERKLCLKLNSTSQLLKRQSIRAGMSSERSFRSLLGALSRAGKRSPLSAGYRTEMKKASRLAGKSTQSLVLAGRLESTGKTFRAEARQRCR